MDVLVVGAGPVGLSAAACLTKLGIKVRIVDKNSEPSKTSKAMGVQSGTLECFDHVFGPEISKNMIETGRRAQAAHLHINKNNPIPVDFTVIPPPHNYILIIEQSKTERVLEEWLNSRGITVERNSELVDLKKNSEGVISTLITKGKTEEVTSQFVIGCDGAHSTVRRLIGLPFAGGTYEGSFLLGDVKINWPWGYNDLRVFANERGALACFPFKEDQLYRLIAIPKKPFEGQTLELAEFKNIVDDVSLGQIQIQESRWLTPFRIHHRIVKSLREGRVILAGDAAHIHSPTGGQGMNIGIQEALNLSFKIKKILQGASLDLLDKYEDERLPIARKISNNTGFFLRLATLQENWVTANARRHILSRVAGNPWVQSKIVRAISQVKMARKEIEQRLVMKGIL